MDVAKLRDLFDYVDGNLIWRRPRKGVNKDRIAGYTRPDGYRATRIDGKSYLVHRLIYLYHNGYMPVVIDHKDGNPANNKIENLRECSMSQNSQNSKIKSGNRSGVKHVRWEQVMQQVAGDNADQRKAKTHRCL